MTDRPANSVDPKLLEILVCAWLTKGRLEYDAEKQGADLARRSSSPPRSATATWIMLPEEARRLK